MGVNLPAHLVVLKGTVRWVGDSEVAPGEQSGYKEYSQTEVRLSVSAQIACMTNRAVVSCTHQGFTSKSPLPCDSQVLQMVGRAGRPQFDTHGVAVIMTSRDSTHKYQKLLAGQVICALTHQGIHASARLQPGTTHTSSAPTTGGTALACCRWLRVACFPPCQST
jgi:replicative superfamily II helicase